MRKRLVIKPDFSIIYFILVAPTEDIVIEREWFSLLFKFRHYAVLQDAHFRIVVLDASADFV